MSKRCPSCDKLLSFDSFYKDKQTFTGYACYCKSCNNTCGICGNTHKDHDKILHVDHDHKTGEIRGLLCSTCNSGIGLLKDDINLLELAIIYLNRRV